MASPASALFSLPLVPTTPLPLSIPELVERVLSYVSAHKRRAVISLVCKQWLRICRHLAFSKLTLSALAIHENPERFQQLVQDRFPISFRLRIVNSNTPKVLPTSQLKRPLQVILQVLQNYAELDQGRILAQFHEVSISISWGENGTFRKFLPFLGNVSIFRLDRFHEKGGVFMREILEACPNLKELYIDSDDQMAWEEQGPQQEEEQEGAVSTTTMAHPFVSPKLRVLVLSRVCLPFSVLETILENCCGELRTLRIVSILRQNSSNEFSRVQVYNLVSKLCPDLKDYHFSFHLAPLPEEEMSKVIQEFPRSQKRSFLDTDFSPVLGRSLISMADRLTELEFVSAPRCQFRERLGVILQQVLALGRHLIHVRAPSVKFSPHVMDLNNILAVPSDWSNLLDPREVSVQAKKRNLTASVLANTTTNSINCDKSVWACKNLQSLHLSIGRPSLNCSEVVLGLVVFGYISRVCPELRELEVHGDELSWSPPSGLCLLTRLESLERLSIHSTAGTGLNREGLDWIRRNRISEVMTLDEKMSEMSLDGSGGQVQAKGYTSGSHPGSNNSRDLRMLGRYEDWTDWAYKSRDRACWPLLESLELVIRDMGERDQRQLRGLMSEIRPDVSFSVADYAVATRYWIP
ncbi:hypothetical protein BGZ83_007289 [Gryganskiella cystojenkinii]|nr:hypothetical protein BGZ83_007289 [Gryganskiella cystojenkinii]